MFLLKMAPNKKQLVLLQLLTKVCLTSSLLLLQLYGDLLFKLIQRQRKLTLAMAEIIHSRNLALVKYKRMKMGLIVFLPEVFSLL